MGNPEEKAEPMTPAEWKVMRIVWTREACAARDVYEETSRTMGWAPTTAKTVLRRLVNKGHLTTTQVGNSFLYRPASTAMKSLLAAADALMENVLEGTSGLLISHMVESCRLSDDELTKLRELLEARAKGPKKGGTKNDD